VVPGGSDALHRQRQRLQSEGGIFRSANAISLRQYRWQPGQKRL